MESDSKNIVVPVFCHVDPAILQIETDERHSVRTTNNAFLQDDPPGSNSSGKFVEEVLDMDIESSTCRGSTSWHSINRQREPVVPEWCGCELSISSDLSTCEQANPVKPVTGQIASMLSSPCGACIAGFQKIGMCTIIGLAFFFVAINVLLFVIPQGQPAKAASELNRKEMRTRGYDSNYLPHVLIHISDEVQWQRGGNVDIRSETEKVPKVPTVGSLDVSRSPYDTNGNGTDLNLLNLTNPSGEK